MERRGYWLYRYSESQMLDHISSYAINFNISRDFYLSVLGSLGASLQTEFAVEENAAFTGQRVCGFGLGSKCAFWLIESRRPYTPRHIAFTAKSQHQVDLFYQTAISSGAGSLGGPGLRPQYHNHYYAAFVRDPDGNNIEAVCHDAY